MIEEDTKLTPMMRQYREAKAQIPPDAILLFRLGDFYEMFFEDAEKASAIMELVLTKRAGVPMCGFPYHALEAQLPRLLAANVKVAIAEQMEDPRFATGIVKREITRIITPGTVVDSSALNPSVNNFLCALVCEKNASGWAVAELDISTGEFRVARFKTMQELLTEFARLGAKECLIPAGQQDWWQKNGGQPQPGHPLMWTELENGEFELINAESLLKKHFHVATLDGFGCKDLPDCISAAGAVLAYAIANLRQDCGHVTKLETAAPGKILELDEASQRNLELVEALHGDAARKHTLLGVLDCTVTPMGGRLLRDWVLRPLYDVEGIVARLDAVDQLKNDPLTLTELRETLRGVRDLERIIGRLNVGNANARDMLALAVGLGVIPGIRLLLSECDAPLLQQLSQVAGDFPELCQRITDTIAENPPVQLNDGGLIRDGFSADLDELRKAATEGKNWLSDIQAREIARTGIKSLKVKFNQVFGYYIEVSKANLASVPEDYIRKQTLVNAERFITPELKELESKILGSEEKARALEFQIFQELRAFILPFTGMIQRSAAALAQIDVLAALAEDARKYRYIRPHINDGDTLSIFGGRHPVLDAGMESGRFVPNDVLLDCDEHRMMLITGPNMAGKSTYIRQTALLVIMAQMGSFIPADSATIGIADRIFTRVGAADDLSRGQSTFMVEMAETANILNCATNRSLVILDEIGRGTSTFDGLSIAWAVAEFLHDDPVCRCRTQFATHYHELTELASIRRGINNFNVAVREYGDKIIFLRQIIPGSTDRSYGIHVAKLAGLPKPVTDRAEEMLALLEKNAGKPRDAMRMLPRAAVRSSKRKRGAAQDECEDQLFQPTLF